MEANELALRLVQNQRDFLAFLQARVGDRAVAEDILHEAFVRGLEHAEDLRDEAAATGWFYRVLRNAVIDHARRHASMNRRLQAFAQELEAEDTNAETMNEVCQCVQRLADTLKPEYAEAVRKVEIEGMSVRDFAASIGISAGNAGVRIFRAREALRERVVRSCGSCAAHGCLDCSCQARSTT